MIKYKYQLLLLLGTCFIYTSPSVYAANPIEPTGSDVYASAGAGWDNPDLTAKNTPDSDQSNQEAYEANSDPRYQPHIAMPLNRNPGSDYTGNGYGTPSYNNPTPTQLIPGPGATLPTNQYGTTTVTLPNTSTRLLTPANSRIKDLNVNGLPPTVLDSFVSSSHGDDSIYGMEGGVFPNLGSSWSYISTGFDRKSKEGLTTGHGGWMPSAWGGDGVQNAFHHDPNDWSRSGPSYASDPANTTDNTAPALHIPTN